MNILIKKNRLGFVLKKSIVDIFLLRRIRCEIKVDWYHNNNGTIEYDKKLIFLFEEGAVSFLEYYLSHYPIRIYKGYKLYPLFSDKHIDQYSNQYRYYIETEEVNILFPTEKVMITRVGTFLNLTTQIDYASRISNSRSLSQDS